MDFDVALSTTTKSPNAQGANGGFMMVHLLDSQSRNVELLAHLASYSELLVAVTGPEGAGKTVVANALAAQREAPEDTLFLTASVMLGMPAILSTIANHWDMPAIYEDGSQSREAIKKEALARAEDGGNLLLIIDQADQLDSDTLNDIAHFALLAPQAISFTLFGLPGYELLFRNSPAQAPVHILNVDGLTDNEVTTLLANVYGDGDLCPLDAREVEQVVAMSGALPGGLLVAAEKLLSAPRKPTVANAASGFPLRNILGIALIVTVLVMLLIYQFSAKEDGSAVVPVMEQESSESNSNGVNSQLPKDDVVTDYNYPALDNGKNVSNSVDAKDTKSTTQETVELEVPTVLASKDGLRDQVVTTNTPVVPTAEPVVSPATPTPKPVSIEAKPAPTNTLKSQTSTSPVAIAKRSYTADELALLKPSAGYIVQLLGSYSADGATGFKQTWKASVTGTLYQYETMHNGQPWFVVVSGVYGSKAEAVAAVNALPPKIRRQSPWVRPLKDAQNALR